jgi:hypothetical protein
MSNVVPPFQRSENDALWSYVNDMASELRELKNKLKETASTSPETQQPTGKYISEEYFAFVNTLRGKMRANTDKNYYPTIRIDGMELGIDFNGLLYDKTTQRTVARALAFDIYHKLYDHHIVKPFFK